MKKIIMLLITVIILVSCNSSNSSFIKENKSSINIFSINEDLAINYIPDEKIKINELTDDKYSEAALIYSDGSVKKLNVNKGNIILNKKNIEDLKGIFLYNNFHSITSAYYETKEFLDKNERVLTVLLDGFSLGQYEYAKDNGYISFLSNYFAHEALSVYTPVTNAGYAAIITGNTPDINGIHDRSYREMKVDSIFQHALDNSKKTILLEGDIKILNTEVEPQLHIDLNKDEDTDDEMFYSTLQAADENYELIFVHFHGIDDRGHSYGPYSEETMDYIKKVDGFISELNENWDGKIILTSDHGMHETEEGGNHGECRSSDMIVPYFTINSTE